MTQPLGLQQQPHWRCSRSKTGIRPVSVTCLKPGQRVASRWHRAASRACMPQGTQLGGACGMKSVARTLLGTTSAQPSTGTRSISAACSRGQTCNSQRLTSTNRLGLKRPIGGGCATAGHRRGQLCGGLRVAEVDEVPSVEVAAAEDDGYEFNFAEARRNNVWQDSDVEAALRFYTEGVGKPVEEEEQITNYFEGMEDAIFFDDIDNNEAYDRDEYAVVGIPEAAPKKRRNDADGRGGAPGGGGDDDDGADFENKIEDRIVVDEDLEEDEMALALEAKGPWDWTGDNAAASDTFFQSQREKDDEKLDAYLTDVSPSELLEVDEEMQDLIPTFVNDFNIDEVDLAVADDEVDTVEEGGVDPALDEAEQEDSAGVEEEEEEGLEAATPDVARVNKLLQRADALLQQQQGEVQSQGAGAEDEDNDITQAMVEDYLKSVRAVMDGPGADESEIRAAIAATNEGSDEASVNLDVLDSEVMSDTDAAKMGELLDTPQLDAKLMDSNNEDEFTSLAKKMDEEENEDQGALKEFEEDIQALESLETDNEGDNILAEISLDALDNYIDETAAYLETIPEDDDIEAEELGKDILTGQSEVTDDVVVSGASAEPETIAFQERIVEIKRVTKVVKGGKLMGFRAVVVAGDSNGKVGVGCNSGREVITAVKRALTNAKKNVITVPLVNAGTIPHRVELKFKSARVVIVPASAGTGVIAGSSVRTVLEMAGVKNCLAKRIGTRSLLNNALCTIEALKSLRTVQDMAEARGLPLEYFIGPH